MTVPSLDELQRDHEAANARLHRAEWIRFLIACSMVLSIIAEAALIFARFYVDFWVWFFIIAAQGYALHTQTKTVTLCRQAAFDRWQMWFDALARRSSGFQ